ncbi:response regulator [Bdellovibrio sp. HCB185ZH]|uniref:response regulator n=1 Tax=Bdellovibrio sp. HCB185ZH TaxID=3394235 RepID=UPI0039A533E9
MRIIFDKFIVTTKPLKLLHIDDSSILRKTVSRGMEEFKDSYELIQVGSVDEALEVLYAGKQFDVILTDWLMPGKSGFNLLCILKSNPAYHRLPIFFLTSEYENSSLVTAVTYGAAGLLKKPTTGPEIHAYLQKRMSVIQESKTPKADSFTAEAKEHLTELQQFLPLKNSLDLSGCLQTVQELGVKARTAIWPLLAEYSQKIEDTIGVALNKDQRMLTPLSEIIKEYASFIDQSVSLIESGKPHPLLPEHLDNDLKNYLMSLDAILIPWEVITELHNHLTPEGQALLDKYLNSKKSG